MKDHLADRPGGLDHVRAPAHPARSPAAGARDDRGGPGHGPGDRCRWLPSGLRGWSAGASGARRPGRRPARHDPLLCRGRPARAPRGFLAARRPDGHVDALRRRQGGRREADTRGTGEVDLWIHYDESGDVIRAEALVEKDVKLTQIFVDGQVAREEWRRHPGGELSAVAIHRGWQGRPAGGGLGRSGPPRSGLGVRPRRPAREAGPPGGRGRLRAGGTSTRADPWRARRSSAKDGEVVAVSFFEDGRLTPEGALRAGRGAVQAGATRVPTAAAVTEG